MKNLIIRAILSMALTASILGCSVNLYDNFVSTNKRVETHKVVIAPWYPIIPIFILMNAVWKKVNGGSSRTIKPKPPSLKK